MNTDLDVYDSWNMIKKRIAYNNNAMSRLYVHDGEVWFTYFGKNLGFEQDGGGR